jgi:hypothetical protein
LAVSAIAQTGQSEAIHSPEAWASVVVANAVRLQLHALAYDLGSFLRTLATPEPIKDRRAGRASPWSSNSPVSISLARRSRHNRLASR